MAETVEIAELLKEQEKIFTSYLDRFQIGHDDPHVTRILDKIQKGQIMTFSEDVVVRQDGSKQVITLLQMNGGLFTEVSRWSLLFKKDPDIELTRDLTILGFTCSVYDREPVTQGSFTALWRGDGLPGL